MEITNFFKSPLKVEEKLDRLAKKITNSVLKIVQYMGIVLQPSSITHNSLLIILKEHKLCYS